MVKELGKIEKITFDERSNVHGDDEIVMTLHTEDFQPAEVELSPGLADKLEWAAKAAERYV